MRSPEEQEYFLASGRFDKSSAEDQRVWVGTLTVLGVIYWLFAAAACALNFFVCFFATLPWSYLVVSMRMQLSGASPIVGFLNSKLGEFLAYPVLCGGLNVLFLAVLLKALSRRKQ